MIGELPENTISLAICSQADGPILNALLEAGGVVDKHSNYLTLAAMHANVTVMDILYKKGVEADMNEALDAAVDESDCATVVWLLDHGAHVQKVPRIIERIVAAGREHTFEVVVDAFRALLRSTRSTR